MKIHRNSFKIDGNQQNECFKNAHNLPPKKLRKSDKRKTRTQWDSNPGPPALHSIGSDAARPKNNEIGAFSMMGFAKRFDCGALRRGIQIGSLLHPKLMSIHRNSSKIDENPSKFIQN